MNDLFQRLLTLCLGLSLGVLAAGGPLPVGTSTKVVNEGAERASTATRQLCQARPRVARKGPALGRPPAPTETQMLWMARAMYVESGTTYGMIRVGETILNRVRSNQHRDTVAGVVTKRWAYTGITVNLLDVKSLGLSDYHTERWREAVRMAHAVLTMPKHLRALPPDTRHYFNPDKVEKPDWARDKLLVRKAGPHKFFAGVNAGSS